MPITDLDGAVQAVTDLITTNAVALGLRTVSYGPQGLNPKYPVAQVAGDFLQRELHTTGYFRNTYFVYIYVMHGNMKISQQQRTKADLQLVRDIVRKLHQNKSMGGELIHSFVSSEQPGRLVGPQGNMIYGTRLTWEGTQTEPLTPA